MRLLILVPGDVGERMSAPAIRAWSLAQALSDRHEVTAAVDGDVTDGLIGRVRVIRATRARLLSETMRQDAVMAACQPPFMLAAARSRGVISIVDHYDPVEQELVNLEGIERRIGTLRALRRLHHGHADVVLCASEAQRRVLLAELELVGRGGGTGPLVGIVPYGLGEAPARTEATPLRDTFPEIAGSDKIVLWWGKIWRWFDAETAIRAFTPLADSRPDIKLVITAGPPPNANTDGLSIEHRARQVAKESGLLGQTVFFLEQWLPYEERHHCLHEADLGLTLHADTPEAKLAARARYMDYAWAGLPCVLAHGDEVSAEFNRAGFAQLVAPGDTEAVTDAITEMVDAPERLANARAAGAMIADRYRWTTLARDIDGLLEKAARSRANPHSSSRLAAGTAGYYLRRAVDILHEMGVAPSGELSRLRGRLKHSARA